MASRGRQAYHSRTPAFVLLLVSFTLVGAGCTSTATGPGVLLAPTNMRIVRLSPTSYQLHWTDRTRNEQGFIIEQSNSASGGFTEVAVVPANTVTWTASGLDSTVTYYFRVAAFTDDEKSYYSLVVDTDHFIQGVGDRAQNFTARDQHGEDISLADYHGRVIALYFNTYNADT